MVDTGSICRMFEITATTVVIHVRGNALNENDLSARQKHMLPCWTVRGSLSSTVTTICPFWTDNRKMIAELECWAFKLKPDFVLAVNNHEPLAQTERIRRLRALPSNRLNPPCIKPFVNFARLSVGVGN
jgi:hypothetical protein